MRYSGGGRTLDAHTQTGPGAHEIVCIPPAGGVSGRLFDRTLAGRIRRGRAGDLQMVRLAAAASTSGPLEHLYDESLAAPEHRRGRRLRADRFGRLSADYHGG